MTGDAQSGPAGGCDYEFVFLGTVPTVEEQGWETPRVVARRPGSGLGGDPSKCKAGSDTGQEGVRRGPGQDF